MRNVPSVSSNKSSSLILCSLEWSLMQFVLKCDQWFYDGLYFSIHYLLLLERTFGWALSHPHIRFSLLSIYLERSLNLRTCVPLDLVCGSNFFLLGSTFCQNVQKKGATANQFAFFDVTLFNLITRGGRNANSKQKLQPICPISIY